MVDGVLVVVGHDADEVAAAATADGPAELVVNPDHLTGRRARSAWGWRRRASAALVRSWCCSPMNRTSPRTRSTPWSERCAPARRAAARYHDGLATLSRSPRRVRPLLGLEGDGVPASWSSSSGRWRWPSRARPR